MTATKDELVERAQIVRAFEASCKIEHPTPDELNFRVALMKRLGTVWCLRELRQVQISGPAPLPPPKPAATPRR